MSDALTEFAHIAALALRDITDPDALQHSADEALAALEQHVTALSREYRCAGKLVARCLYKHHSKNYRDPCEASATLTYLRAAFIWSHTSYMAASLMKAGEEVGMARATTDAITRDKLELRTVLRAVVNAVEQSIVEMACEKMHGRAA